jgi:large subunit ribosomal protein L17
MRHKNKGKILDRDKAAREMMLRNLASSVLMYEKIKTTLVKAKTVRSLVEKSISIAKDNTLTARRKLIEILPQKMAVKKAIEVLGPRFKDRKGGYTRITKLNNRKGDGADVVLLELV